MNNITYSWLLNSDKQTPKLIDCILILSCNDLFISHDNLMKYYNDNSSKTTSSTTALINENGKRYNNNNKNNNSNNNNGNDNNEDELYGLSKKQFNILHNNIDQLRNLINNNENINSISNSSKNDNKFDWAINIIIHNNNNINMDNKRIKNDNNTKKTISNNIEINHIKNNQQHKHHQRIGREMNQLFYMVWRNVILRNQILFHTRLYKIHWGTCSRFTLQELDEYKYKHYLDELELANQDYQILKPNSIPYGVKEIDFVHNAYAFEKNCIPDSVTRIKFPYEFNQIITKGIIPDTVTTIQFNQFNQALDGWLPKSITHLDLGDSFHQSILPGQLPDSLTELELPSDYMGTIIPGSIPSAVKNLDFTFNSDDNETLLTNDSIPKSITSLEFDDSFYQDIEVGDIPHNVTSLEFKSSFSHIELGSLPLSLKTFISNSKPDETLARNVLPSNLTYIDLGAYNYQFTSNTFPRSVKTIKLSYYNQTIPVGLFYKYLNLTTLIISKLTQDEISLRTLPPSLTFLDVNKYEGPLDAIVELKSLKTLYLGGVERELIAGELPESITELSLKTSLPIGPNLLPPNLKKLFINTRAFNHDISIDGYLPTSLDSICILHDHYDLINLLNVNFFHKYIDLF